ncbi:MAG: Sapep family Mn(2+)-dependent dipeptidase [Eggerthellaceae bacterium]|nr:Sapep family Mn(2+)-dependent dipeptidase [Eggerthellaceae bacterium]
MEQNISKHIDAYLDEHWEDIVSDIDRLVRIPSTENRSEAAEGSPFGPGPKAALSEALRMAASMGFDAHDVDGYIGYADYPGLLDAAVENFATADVARSAESGAAIAQLGIIGHVDVVPAGPGWTVPPFQVTRREGYLMGRGVIDDKGPTVVALHALKFWKDQGVRFPCTVRFLFGANEESGMADIEHYQSLFDDPAFLFTPDAEFPVCYGEKGMYNATVTGPAFENGIIADFQGGVATNAVPGEAFAVVRADAATLPGTNRISVSACGDAGEMLARLDATGKSAHASLPETGVSAIALLVDYLLEQDLCSPDERAFLEFEQKLVGASDGSGLGIASCDEHFGALTVVGGVASMKDGRIVQSIDSRFPTSVSASEITRLISAEAAKAHAVCVQDDVMEPFLMDPQSPMIQALLSAYNEATGENARPFTMGGGTYARHFSNAASFGPEKPWESAPEWAGSMHGPDEAVSEDLLKQAFRIYALTLPKLCEALCGK